jgi:phosphoribosylglycinamide formyltransferase-1
VSFWTFGSPRFFILSLEGFKKIEFIEVFCPRRGDRNTKEQGFSPRLNSGEIFLTLNLSWPDSPNAVWYETLASAFSPPEETQDGRNPKNRERGLSPMRLAVFASGRGSNFAALLKARADGRLPEAEFVLLFSDKADARALDLAREAGLATLHLAPRDFENRTAYEQALTEHLRTHRIEGICLAGYMRLVGTTLLSAYPQRILNIHPALLPAFPGLHGHRDALLYGVKISGCTVHFVDSGMDTGPIILQRSVPVLDDDTEETLAARILEQEHLAYPEAVDLFTRGQLSIEGRRVMRCGA